MIRILSLLFLVVTFGSCIDSNSTNNSDTSNSPQSTTPITSPTKPGKGEQLATYEETNRVIWQKPDFVLELLGDISDKVVADIGAGKGFFAIRLTPKAKKVIATDIEQRFIDYMDSVKRFELPVNVQDKLEIRKVERDTPGLEPGEADVVMIVNTFMWIVKYNSDPEGYIRSIREVLPEGGRLLILDFKKKRTPLGPDTRDRVPLFEAEEMMYRAGFKEVTTYDTKLEFQYIIIAEK